MQYLVPVGLLYSRCLGSGAVYSMLLIWLLGSGARCDKALSVLPGTALML
jgi:hypothetical protein